MKLPSLFGLAVGVLILGTTISPAAEPALNVVASTVFGSIYVT